MNVLPFNGSQKAAGIVLYGGYPSAVGGCPVWGSSLEQKALFFGDKIGELLIETKEKTQALPLVLGYTLWFNYGEILPETVDNTAYANALSNALYVQNAADSTDKTTWKLYVKVNGTVKSISIVNGTKECRPVFAGFDFVDELPEKFAECGDVPQCVSHSIDRINRITLTYLDEKHDYPEYTHSASKVEFYGENSFLLNAVFHENVKDLASRVDDTGFLHTSQRDAPSWRYDGYGTFINCGQYYNDFYARDGGRAIMTLEHLGYYKQSRKAIGFAMPWLMYFCNKNLSIKGKKIPGHFTMVINDPTFYHRILTKYGWYTQYTSRLFGDDYANMGSLETDGHGFMMMALATAYRNCTDKKAFAGQNAKYALEAGNYIIWCLDNPDVSFAKYGLLYGEGEATQGTNGYSLYANVPCMLGLIMCAEILREAEDVQNAQRLLACCDKLKRALINHLCVDGKWKLSELGYYHDCIPTFLSDVYGYDTTAMPQDLLEISRNTYQSDVGRSRDIPYDASGGMGYNTAMRLQNAMLLDITKDYAHFMRQMLALCYAPTLPQPYIVPECASYSLRLNAIRRQGDLGNLVQQAETVKCLLIAMGVSYCNGKLVIMPRLYGDIGYKATLPLQNGNIKLSINKTDIEYELTGIKPQSITVRFGPFDKEPTDVKLMLNGKRLMPEPVYSGDAWWSLHKI